MHPISPKKLLNSKWTAVDPARKEKHFLVSKMEFDENGAVIHCLMEAVMTRRWFKISWRELRNASVWISGWQ